MTAAYSYAPSKEISVFDYSQVRLLGNPGLGMFFGQIPDALSFVGYALIIAVAVLLYRHNQKVGG